MNEDNFDNDDDDDVIIEGSDLHKALVDMGLTEFESISVHRTEFNDVDGQDKNYQSLNSQFSKQWLKNVFQNIQDIRWFYHTENQSFHGFEQLQIMLKLDPLLNDHSQEIHKICDDSSLNHYDKIKLDWSSSLILSSIAAGLMSPCLRMPGFVTFSCSVLILAYNKYLKLCSIKTLEDIVFTQNKVYYLYKKVLKVLKNTYCIRMSNTASSKRFSDLEIEKLKYLQPMCETFIESIEKLSYSYYHISSFLKNLITKLGIDYSTTNFDNEFTVGGEITFESLKKLYYVYILVQSEMMMLLATAYRTNSLNSYFINQKFVHIMKALEKLLQKYHTKLNIIFGKYRNCNIVQLNHKLNKNHNIKWHDFYTHLDLLTRKIQSTYSNICSVIDDVDNGSVSEETDEFLETLMDKMNMIYKDIDTAKNFAEFNILLIGKYRRPRLLNDPDMQFTSTILNSEKELPIVYDKDPFIVDEVFEEYIKEEYIKPLYEDSDLDSYERIKLDELLAKNFRSELKEVLIDKCRSMSEREEIALQRKKGITVNNKINNESENFEKKILDTRLAVIDVSENQNKSAPVPLPRTKKFYSDSEMNPTIVSNSKKNIYIPDDDLTSEQEMKERFSINMNIHGVRFPVFTVAEETFAGSGENSDEELIDDKDRDHDKDQEHNKDHDKIIDSYG